MACRHGLRCAHQDNRRSVGDEGIAPGLWWAVVVYHFDVDGAFWLDPHDEARIPNAWGSEFSVRQVIGPRRCR